MNLLTRSNIVIAVLTLAVIILLLTKGCSNEPVQSIDKNKIVELKGDKDSIRERIVYKDRIKTEYVVKWRNFKGKVDSIPCPDALNQAIILTDSIIVVDSSLVASLKAELFVDSLIIKNQEELITQDSIKIVSLNKEVKKQNRRKKLWRSVSIALGVVAIIK